MIDGAVVFIHFYLIFEQKPYTNILHVSRYNQKGKHIIKSSIIQIILFLGEYSLVK